MKQMLSGNAAVARGVYEAGGRFVSAYPGTPSTEIAENAAKYKEIYTEWSTNEKVAMEAAIGASLAGARSLCAMKHVGLNVAADPLFSVAYTGINGGLVVAVADDPGQHSSQNEQDSRRYAIAAKVPMLEPSDASECLAFTKAAFELSETYDTPVLLRTCTRVAHASDLVEPGERETVELKAYEKSPAKYVVAPANATKRRVVVDERCKTLAEYAETAPFNRVEWGSTEVGFVTSGTSYLYVKEVFPEASVFKIGMSNPMPVRALKDFADKVGKVIVVEELDDIIESHMRMNGIRVDIGKAAFGNVGEFSPNRIRKALDVALPASRSYGEAIPVRPPVMCPGCPHRGLFSVLKEMKLTVFGDIGCYTLGASAPLGAMDTAICMGASIGMVHAFNKVRPETVANAVAAIGDSTFFHSGMTGLVDLVYNKGIGTVLILDNSTTGMTGHQPHPATGKTICGDIAPAVSIEAVCNAAGVSDVTVVDPLNMAELKAALKRALSLGAPSVIIARRPCALLKGVTHYPPVKVNTEKCVGCKACMQIGCPAVSMKDGHAVIDASLCVGCGLCEQKCRVGALEGGNKE